MIEVSEGFKFACRSGTVRSELDIEVFMDYDGQGGHLHIKNKNIVSESMKIEQAISDDSDLKFGGCIAGSFEIELSNVPDITGEYITVSIKQTAIVPTYPGQQLFPGAKTYPGFTAYTESFALFSGEVYSCKFSKNRITRKLVAYDRFYWRGSVDCTSWYRSLYSGRVQITIYELRKALCSKFGIVEADSTVTLPADDLQVQMIEGNVTVAQLLQMIGEFNGVFLYFNGRGNLCYRSLNKDTAATEEYEYYQNAECEDYTKEPYTGIYFNLSEGGYPFSWNNTDNENLYFAEDNTLIVTGYDNAYRLGVHLAGYQNLLKPYYNIEYTPMSLQADTRLWVELGDRIKCKIKWYSLETDGDGNEYAAEHEETVCSYVLSRRISGIQALTDEISANGENIHYTEDSDFGD